MHKLPPGPRPRTRAGALVQIDGELLEQRERHDLECARVSASQHDARCHALLVCLEPARSAQAPAVAGLQPWKVELRPRGGEIVAAEARELEEVLRDLDADRMRADVLIAGVTATVAKKPGLG